jgi:hypothetical protein
MTTPMNVLGGFEQEAGRSKKRVCAVFDVFGRPEPLKIIPSVFDVLELNSSRKCGGKKTGRGFTYVFLVLSVTV